MGKKRKREAEGFVYGSVLDALGQGLYPDKRHVIREFAQNACDAVREYGRYSGEQAEDPVEIMLQPPSVTIYDRGIGMQRRLMQQYRYVGFSEKDADKNVGFRGIGTISGIAVAKRMIVTSSRVGVAKRYRVVIHAEKILNRVRAERNPRLEDLLSAYTEVSSEPADKEEHFTFVELNGVLDDSSGLYDEAGLSDYLSRVLPLPFDPDFQYGREVSGRLHLNGSGFYEVDVELEGKPLYKPFLANALPPEFEPVFFDDEKEDPVLAYCWHCMHASKGQLPDKKSRGLVYRLKNFAVGGPQLTRTTLWKTTPERAFYFFGEIHLLDQELVPSSDRDQFEDNAARKQMYVRCSRIARVLNRRAGTESEQRRFGDVIREADAAFATRERDLKRSELPADLRDDVQFEIRTTLENVEKRLRRARSRRQKSSSDERLIAMGAKTSRRGRSLLRKLSKAEQDGSLLDIAQIVTLSRKARMVYDAVVEVLREELAGEPAALERILRVLHKRIKKKLG